MLLDCGKESAIRLITWWWWWWSPC